jgi:predicted Zn-dependent protease
VDRKLLDGLARHPGIHDWTVRRRLARGAQVYLVGGAVESVRSVEREAYEVELFNDHDVEGERRRGSVTVPLARADLGRLCGILDDAVAMAALVHNPPWSLPEPAPYPDVALADPELIDGDTAAIASGAAEEIRAAAEQAPAGVRLSSAELFLTATDEEIASSRGIHGQATSTRALMELTLLADGEQEAEFFRVAEARRLADVGVADLVTDGARHAQDAARAHAPRTRLGPVVMSANALDQLLSGGVVGSQGAFLFQASAAAAYRRIGRFEIGESVFLGAEPSADSFTMRANARRAFGLEAYRFDEDGLPAQDVLLIEGGVLRARAATQRYAQYLDVAPTGVPGVQEISAGPTPLAELLDGDPLEVIAFSAPNVDPVTGSFGMEIRLGYQHGPSGVIPIHGGSVTGNLFEAMAAARFSRETGVFRYYSGPQAIRFESLQVAGEDS